MQDVAVQFSFEVEGHFLLLLNLFFSFPLFLFHSPIVLSQLQLLNSSVRLWKGTPDCSCVRVAQDVTAEPASTDQCWSLWQREPGWLHPEPQQQQLHQHQERNTVRIAMETHVSFTESIRKCLMLWVFLMVSHLDTHNKSNSSLCFLSVLSQDAAEQKAAVQFRLPVFSLEPSCHTEENPLLLCC